MLYSLKIRDIFSFQGSSSSPDDGSPEIHAGFRSVMKELKKRMSDVQLPVDGQPAVDDTDDEFEDQRPPQEGKKRKWREPLVVFRCAVASL